MTVPKCRTAFNQSHTRFNSSKIVYKYEESLVRLQEYSTEMKEIMDCSRRGYMHTSLRYTPSDRYLWLRRYPLYVAQLLGQVLAGLDALRAEEGMSKQCINALKQRYTQIIDDLITECDRTLTTTSKQHGDLKDLSDRAINIIEGILTSVRLSRTLKNW